jgi:DNA-binding beta-propeller fold protein YncE
LASTFAASASAARLVQLPGKQGCVSSARRFNCASGRMVAETEPPLAMSPDGKSAYLIGAEAEESGEADALDVFDRDPATGALTQKPGSAGCVAGSGADGCAKDGRLRFLRDAVLSPDGKDVYVTIESGVAGFARDPETGALTPIAGPTGCVASPRHRAGCQVGEDLEYAYQLAFSPDGEELYVTSTLTPTIAVLRRDPTTGALSQASGAAGCVTVLRRDLSCDARRFPRMATTAIVAAPDGRSVYVVAANESGGRSLQIFRRQPDGALVHPGGRQGCVAANWRGCRHGRALAIINDLALSPDGRFLYVSSSGQNVGGGIAVFRRGPSGSLTQGRGTAACVVPERPGGGCRVVPLLSGPSWIAVSPDGTNVYASTDLGLEVLRRSASGALTELPGAAGCFVRNFPPCGQARGIEFPAGLSVSQDGANVYVTNLSPSGVAVFRRSPSGVAGRITPH